MNESPYLDWDMHQTDNTDIALDRAEKRRDAAFARRAEAELEVKMAEAECSHWKAEHDRLRQERNARARAAIIETAKSGIALADAPFQQRWAVERLDHLGGLDAGQTSLLAELHEIAPAWFLPDVAESPAQPTPTQEPST